MNIFAVVDSEFTGSNLTCIFRGNHRSPKLHKLIEGAEDEGFEPSVGCPTHAFQACALGRYANPPVLLTRLKGIGGDD